MSKRQHEPVNDSAELLAERQGEILKTIYTGIQKGGLTSEQWMTIETQRLSKATRGYISEKCHRVLDNFTDYGFYKTPYRLSKLVKLLRREFYGVQKIYTQAGRVQLTPETPEVSAQSTLAEPMNIQKSLKRGKN